MYIFVQKIKKKASKCIDQNAILCSLSCNVQIKCLILHSFFSLQKLYSTTVLSRMNVNGLAYLLKAQM